MTVLLTGGAGYIGSHMAHELADAGEPFIVLDDLSNGFVRLLPRQAEFVRGDVGDSKLLADLFQSRSIDTIVHFAGSTLVSESIRTPLQYYRNNTANSTTLIECAINAGVRRFIFSSTSAVYGKSSTIPIHEDAKTEPASPYGWSKLMVERILRDASAASGLRYAILRYFNACAADPQLRTGHAVANSTHVMKVAVEAALGRRRHMEVFGADYPTPDGTCIRDYIHVSDLVKAHMLSMQYLRGGGASATLNCGYGRGYSVLEVIDPVKRVTGTTFNVVAAPRRAGDRIVSVAACERIRSLLGWAPRFEEIDTMVAHAVAWERHLDDLRGDKAAHLDHTSA